MYCHLHPRDWCFHLTNVKKKKKKKKKQKKKKKKKKMEVVHGAIIYKRPLEKMNKYLARAVPCRAVPCRAVPCRAVPCRCTLYSTTP